jgi:uncharacterized protein with PIN domain
LTDLVLDSCALLAFLHNEYNATAVRDLLKGIARHNASAHMTEMNYAEVKYIVLRKHGAGAWPDVADTINALPIQFHPVTRDLADLAAD